MRDDEQRAHPEGGTRQPPEAAVDEQSRRRVRGFVVHVCLSRPKTPETLAHLFAKSFQKVVVFTRFGTVESEASSRRSLAKADSNPLAPDQFIKFS